MKKILYALIAVMVISSFTVTGCTPVSDDTPIPPITENNDDPDITDDPVTPPEDEPVIPPEDEPVIPPVDDPVIPPEDNPVKPPVNVSQTDKELEPYWSSVREIALSAQNYYTENFNKTRLVSKNGKLHDASTGEDVTTSTLVEKGYLASKYKTYDCSILLLKTEDVKQYRGISLANDEEGLSVFAVIKNPKANSHLLTTARSKGGLISTADYINLLTDYSQNHGSVGRLMSGTEEYNRIINFLSMYEGKFGKYYIRSVTKDNKYAVVVLSSQSDVNNVRQYILRKENNVWEVVMDKLENESRPNVAVNKKLPDFNPDLLPDYTLYDYKKTLLSDYTGILYALVVDKLIDSIADVKYIAGADDFCYVVLNNEVKYICYNGSRGWDIDQVADIDEATDFMRSVSLSAPTFIILDR
ncbi:MAG: hypothetical protein E7235_02010 [Lachnospiraceae bacterium]|nr:hypothetical protein [Lachnospiraceae bacterium]